MVFTSKKVSWDNVRPIVLFWTITAEITKLKEFLHLFANLINYQERAVIWKMTQPEGFTRIYNSQLQDIYDCISCSPQLTTAQINMRNNGDNFLWYDQYTSIKTDIADILEYNERYEEPSDMCILITRLLQLSSPELVDELFHHYNDIWGNLINWDNYEYCIKNIIIMPTMISTRERLESEVAIHGEIQLHRNMLYMHNKLSMEIIIYRNDVALQLLDNINIQLTELHQVLKELM